MSGNNKEEWDKFLNGGSSHYNFSYRQQHALNQMPIVSSPMPSSPSTPVNASKSRAKNNKTQKIMLPALKGADAIVIKNRGLKGGAKRRRMRTHRLRK
jgi:hypothetical protein